MTLSEIETMCTTLAARLRAGLSQESAAAQLDDIAASIGDARRDLLGDVQDINTALNNARTHADHHERVSLR